MNETQRILEIMRVKNLSNIQFSSITGISPATLSQLTSGRSNPTHTIFKKIVSAFPDINPAWIAFGIGEMFVSGADVSGQPPIQVDSSTNVADDNFSFNSDPSFVQPEKPAPAQVIPSHYPVNAASNQAEKHIDTAVQPNIFDKEDSHQVDLSATSLSAISAAVKEAMTQERRPQRRIMEVRIFFDDGTYESFGGPK